MYGKFYPLSEEERAASDFTHAYELSPSRGDIPAGIDANTDLTESLAVVPIGLVVKRCAFRLVKAFKDASDSAFNSTTVDVGDSNSATRFISGVQINENGTEVVNEFDADEDYTYAAAYTLQVNFNSMSGKSLSDLDVGKIIVFFQLFNPSNPRWNATP